ncbi:hypothetical protein [Streptomyces sp. NBC_00425]|uniref:hypothetical protein n=1 Tax=Streptomyces sp. NBC_00425 TaxID=2975740 RepID=UPI002E1AF6F0
MTEQHAVSLDSATYTQITLLARAWGTSQGEAVSRLVDHFQQAPTAPPPSAAATSASDKDVLVHALYGGKKIMGRFDPVSRSLTITDGPGAGHYKTPSGAAAAVLQAVNPSVNPNRNGWSFWVVDETGGLLQSLRHQ